MPAFQSGFGVNSVLRRDSVRYRSVVSVAGMLINRKGRVDVKAFKKPAGFPAGQKELLLDLGGVERTFLPWLMMDSQRTFIGMATGFFNASLSQSLAYTREILPLKRALPNWNHTFSMPPDLEPSIHMQIYMLASGSRSYIHALPP